MNNQSPVSQNSLDRLSTKSLIQPLSEPEKTVLSATVKFRSSTRNVRECSEGILARTSKGEPSGENIELKELNKLLEDLKNFLEEIKKPNSDKSPITKKDET